jgi:voltage-gated potassium channel
LERHAQPETFGSVTDGVWWAIVTLTSTGYGDAVPQTALGRLLAGAVMVGGLAVVAMLTGVLVTGFGAEMRRRAFLQAWTMLARVPLFARLDSASIAELAEVLRPIHVAAGETVFSRGDEPDGVYFVVEGSVRVDLDPPLVCKRGEFFGETALLEGLTRVATATAEHPTELLFLDIAEFHQLAAKRSALTAIVKAEHARRMATLGDRLDRDGDGEPG